MLKRHDEATGVDCPVARRRSLYVALKSRYNSTNSATPVYLSARGAAKEIGSNKDYVTALVSRGLRFYGFTADGHPGPPWPSKVAAKPPHWRLTEEWFTGETRPTRDYLNWNGENNSTSRKARKPAPPAKNRIPSLKLGTLCPLRYRMIYMPWTGCPPPKWKFSLELGRCKRPPTRHMSPSNWGHN